MTDEFTPIDRDDKSNVCPACGSAFLASRIETEPFNYGTDDHAVELDATVPVTVCKECAFEFYPPEAEEAKHKAVCEHLGVMLPKQVISIRESLGLTRAQFAELTKLGEATIGRWERGSIIQNAANDQYLFLLKFRDNIDRLHQRQRDRISENQEFERSMTVKFPKLSNAEKVAREQQHFQLRKPG